MASDIENNAEYRNYITNFDNAIFYSNTGRYILEILLEIFVNH